jgi:hypothetical protein
VAHPNRVEATESHNQKMRRMTDQYGSAAGPENNIPAPTNRLKGEGPEPASGFGADSGMPKARGDRLTRSRGIPNRKHGGKVKHRDMGGTTADSPVEEANLNQSMGSKADGRARGGRTKSKHGTHVNVIVAPQGGPGAGAGLPPPVLPPGGVMGAPAAPPPMPPRPLMAPPGGPGAMPPGAGAGMPPGGLPPGMMPPHARGGAVGRAKGGAVHKDAKQDKALIEKTLHDEGLIRSDKAEKEPLEGRAKGGRMNKPDMTAGAGSAVGRLEKMGDKPKNAGRPQAV